MKEINDIEELKQMVIAILEEMLCCKEEYKEALKEINIKLRDKIIMKNGKYHVKGKTIEEQDYIISLIKNKEMLTELNNILPLEGEMKKIIHFLNNDIFIASKYLKILLDIQMEDVEEYHSLFVEVIVHHNLIVKVKDCLEEYQRETKRKNIKKYKVPKKIDVLERVDVSNELINNEDDEIEEISAQAQYYNQMLESEEYSKVVRNELSKQVKLNDYKCIIDLKYLIEEEQGILLNSDQYDKAKIEKINSKLVLIHEILTEKDNIEEVSEPNEDYENQLYFAPKGCERIYIEEDLKNIPDEYYDNVYKLLNAIKTNNFSGIENKKITNNGTLSNLRELKIFKLRLFYRLLGSNNIQIIMLSMKKSDADKLLLSRMVTRYAKTNKNYLYLKKRIYDNTLEKEEKETEVENYQRIILKLNKNRNNIK